MITASNRSGLMARRLASCCLAFMALLMIVFTVSCADRSTPELRGMFRGGPDHSGVYDEVSADGHGTIEWSYQTDGPVRGSPLVDSDLVVIGSGDGNLYAIERDTGRERWRFDAGSPIHSSPAGHGNLIYFGDRSNDFYAVHRSDGRLVWGVTTGEDHAWEWGNEGWDYFTSSPLVADSLVIVGSGDGTVYAFDATSGAERWRVKTDGRVRSSPAVADGVVYVGSADGHLYAIGLEMGGLLWRFETEGASNVSADFGFDRKTIQSSPAVVDGTVYFGSRDGGTYAVDASSGRLRWHYDHTTPWVISSPAISNGSLFSGTSDGLYVHSLDLETGEENWRFETGNRVFSSPAISGDVMYVGTHSRRLLALETASGSLSWEMRFGGAVMSSPVLHDDHIYVGSDDGAVYSIRLAAGSPPRRAVYWDADRVAWNTVSNHEDVRDYFEAWGYEVLDRFQLAAFMSASIDGEDENSVRSVVVFAMDDLPRTVARAPADTVLAIRYLEAGGKIVWLGLPPLSVVRDAQGQASAFDRERSAALLGVDFERYDLDQYAAYATAKGKKWGLGNWWMSLSGVDTSQVTQALALDEDGRASAWVKSYGGPPGTGFVYIYGTHRKIPASLLNQTRLAAEQGIGIVADPDGG
jgi:outer membrane protein assembly factor BamB